MLKAEHAASEAAAAARVESLEAEVRASREMSNEVKSSKEVEVRDLNSIAESRVREATATAAAERESTVGAGGGGGSLTPACYGTGGGRAGCGTRQPSRVRAKDGA